MVLDDILATPGPTPVEAGILLESARPVLNHVSPEFEEIHAETLDMLKRLFNSGGVVLIPGSGTAAMELALRMAGVRGRRVLVLKTGHFGGYLEEGARLLGGVVTSVEAPLGEGFTGSMLEELLGDGYDVVLFQHVDTSTSVANPLRELVSIARRMGVLTVIDAVASAGGMMIDVDNWGVDIVFTGSQKALSTPPGLGIVAYRSGLELAGDSSLYFNIPKLLKEMESTRNYYITPAVTLVRSLHASLKRIHREGMEARARRHQVLAEAVRAGVEALGLELVAKEGWRADTVTAIHLPEGVEWSRLYAEARKRGVELAGGLGSLKGRIFRIGHMGEASPGYVVAVLAAVERSLARLGYRVKMGASLAAAQEVLDAGGL